MKKTISNLDFIINISARKMRYFEQLVSKYREHQEAIKDTIVDMDNSVFLTSYEIQNHVIFPLSEKNELNGDKIREHFKDTFKKRYPDHYIEVVQHTSF